MARCSRSAAQRLVDAPESARSRRHRTSSSATLTAHLARASSACTLKGTATQASSSISASRPSIGGRLNSHRIRPPLVPGHEPTDRCLALFCTDQVGKRSCDVVPGAQLNRGGCLQVRAIWDSIGARSIFDTHRGHAHDVSLSLSVCAEAPGASGGGTARAGPSWFFRMRQRAASISSSSAASWLKCASSCCPRASLTGHRRRATNGVPGCDLLVLATRSLELRSPN